MNKEIILTIVLIFIILKYLKCWLALKVIKFYVKKIDRYPTSEDIDTCTREMIEKMVKKSNT